MARSALTLPYEREISQSQFDGGITSNARDVTKNGVTIATNFDIFTDPKRLIPYRDSESGDSSASTSQKQAFEIGNYISTYKLYGLGVVLGTGKAELLMKDLTSGGSEDLGDATWATPINNDSTSGATSFNLFRYYKTTNKIYGARAGAAIWSYTCDGSTGMTDTEHSLSYTRIGQGVVHSQDDILYIPYDNKIATNNAGSWVDNAISVPDNFYISCIAEYGTFLAIACAPISGIGKSRVYLWDRNSSNTTFTENIDWGDGVLNVIEEYEGRLIGISLVGNNQTRLKARIVFKYYLATASTGALHIITLMSENSSATLLSVKQKADDRLYFAMSLTLGGVVREGIWSIALSNKKFAIAHERTPYNDTFLVNGSLLGFFIVGEFFFISSTDTNAAFQLAKTNDQASYTATAILETFIFNEDNPLLSKDLVGLTTMTEPLPNGASTTTRFKADSDTSFTAISYEADAGSISSSAVNQELNSEAALPKAAKELRFRVESTGGAVITGYSFKIEVYNKNPY